MTDMTALIATMADSHISSSNKYFTDSKYCNFPEIIQYLTDLDNPAMYADIFTSKNLDQLLDIPNRFCYKHFNDEDIAYTKMTLSPEKLDIHASTYKNVISRLNIDVIKQFQQLNITEITTPNYEIHDENLEIYKTMYELLNMCRNYFAGKSTEIPIILTSQVGQMINEFHSEVNMNPFALCYNTMTNLQIEMMILINLAAFYVKIINRWCGTHSFNFYDLDSKIQRRYLRLLNNYLTLVFEIAFSV